MDENLDWEGKMLHPDDPSNFQSFMKEYFYGPVREELAVPEENRFFLTPENYHRISEMILNTEIDYTLGGWGQDGHVAFNQARRDPYTQVTLDDIRNSTARIQNNNTDTILALAHRSFGSAWQFMPPMSLTLGVKECFKAKKIRVYSATGAWKQTALRVARMRLLQLPWKLQSIHLQIILNGNSVGLMYEFKNKKSCWLRWNRKRAVVSQPQYRDVGAK